MNPAALSLIALAIAVTLSRTTKINVGMLAWGMSTAIVAAIGCQIVFGLLWR